MWLSVRTGVKKMVARLLRGPAIVGALSLTLLSWLAVSAFAELSITTRAALHEGFGRIVFDWPALPKYQATRDGLSLRVTFEKPFEASFDDVNRVLGAYLSAIELNGDGRTVEIELTAELDYRAFTYGNKVIIDLMDPESGVLEDTADAESAPQGDPAPASAANNADEAAGDRPEAPRVRVDIRIGDHPNFSRVVFDWPGAVDYRVTTVGNRTVIRFDRRAEIDVSNLNASPPKNFLSAEVKIDGQFTEVTLVTGPATRIRHFRADLRIVIDALVSPASADAGDAAPQTQQAETQQDETQQAEAAPEAISAGDPMTGESPSTDPRIAKPKAMDKPTRDIADQAPPPTPSMTAAAESGVDPVTENAGASTAEKPDSGPETQPTEAPIELAAEAIPALPAASTARPPEPAGESPVATSRLRPENAAETNAETDAETVIEKTTPAVTTAQLTLGPPSMKITVENETNRTLVTFDGGKRTSSAAFMRGEYLWVIFEEPFTIDLSAARPSDKTAYAMVEQRSHDKATVLRFKLRDGFGATMRRRRHGVQWLLQITPSPEPPEAIELRVIGDAATSQRVQLPLARVGDHLQIRDPADRSTIDVVPVMASGSGIAKLHRLAQFDLLATLQGVAIIGPDQIQVFTTLAGVEITTRADPARTAPALETVKQRARPVTTLFELVAWRRGDESEFAANRFALQRAVATASKRELGNARFDLARFMFAHGYMAEAFGILKLLVEQEPARAENISLRAMRGVMNLAMNRVPEATGDLSATVFDAYDDVAMWRGVLAMKQGDVSGASAYFEQAGDLWLELSSPLRERVGLMAAEVILDNGDLAQAKTHLDILRSTTKNYDTLQRVNHLTGRILLASNNREEAVDLWRRVIAGSDRLARARAIYDDTLMMLGEKQISLKEAISEIESLRYAWRADDFELTVLRQLAALYIRDGQYRQGLATMKLAVTHFSDFSATADIASRMNELFAEIFLRDGAEDMPAIDALTLYFEFQELMPVGAEGDVVIQRLADRLVALDLLGRAAELLDHQLKYRLRGVEMARVGTRLAIIQLMNGSPNGAIRALRRSRLKNMPEDLLVQRRHIRVRALADLGRIEDAMKRLVGDNSADAELLRADVAWRAGNWREVAEATERLLELTPIKRPVSSFASRHLLRYAVALALADDQDGLKRLNRLYTAVMRDDPNRQAFDVITSDTGSRTASFSELPKAVARVASFEAFMSSYRERVKKDSLSAIN